MMVLCSPASFDNAQLLKVVCCGIHVLVSSCQKQIKAQGNQGGGGGVSGLLLFVRFHAALSDMQSALVLITEYLDLVLPASCNAISAMLSG